MAGFASLCNADGPYTNFRVIGAALRVELLTSNAGDNLLFVIAPVNMSPYGSATEAAQGWGSVRRFSGFGQGGRSLIQRAWSIADIAGVSKMEVMTNDDWVGTDSSQPPVGIYADIWYATADGATNSGTITMTVSIAIDVLFERPQWSVNLEDVDDDFKVEKIKRYAKAVADKATTSKQRPPVMKATSSAAKSAAQAAASAVVTKEVRKASHGKSEDET